MHASPKKVLVFCISGLGDAVMASPALAALAAERSRFQLTMLTMYGSVAAYLKEQQFGDVRIIDFINAPKAQVFRQLWALRRERFDIGIVSYPHNRIEYNAVNFVIGARQRIGYRYLRQSVRNLPGLNHHVIPEDPSLHVVQENLRWAAYLLGTTPDALPSDMVFEHSPESLQGAEKFCREQGVAHGAPLIGLHPSCNPLKNQQNRCWPPQHFVQLIERLRQQLPEAQFVLFEGPQDAQLAQFVHENAKSAVHVARMLPVGVVGALIRRCQLFISNCSGLIHIAAACKVPTVGIYGPTNPVWDRPWNTEAIIVTRRLPCSPCFYYSSRPLDCPAKLDYACVRELPVADVEAAALHLLRLANV